MDAEYLVRVAFFLSGVVVGHWLNLWRDRRAEFNVAADALYHALVEARESAEMVVSDRLLDDVTRRMPRRRLARWEAAVSEYRRSVSRENQQPDGCGDFLIRDPARVHAAIDRLVGFVWRR